MLENANLKYDWILFDADETLFSFNSYLGLKPLLAHYGVAFSEQDYEAFQAVNRPLWVRYQAGEISAEELRAIRFASLSAQTGVSTEQLNLELMQEMALHSTFLDGVEAVLNTFLGKIKMGIITNGFNALQKSRLKNTNSAHFFDIVTVSEDIGKPKPDRAIFEHTFAQMGQVDKARILMVGDTLESDILGGNRAGIDTCWLNAHHKPNQTDITPTYEIADFSELLTIVQR